MSAINPICVPCRVEMTCEETGCTINDPAVEGFPSTYWSADKFKCSKCGHEIVTNIASEGQPAEVVADDEKADSIEFAYYGAISS